MSATSEPLSEERLAYIEERVLTAPGRDFDRDDAKTLLAEVRRLKLQIQAIRDALSPMSCGCYQKAFGLKPKGEHDRYEGFTGKVPICLKCSQLLPKREEVQVMPSCPCRREGEALIACERHAIKRKCVCPNGTRTAIAHVNGCPEANA